MACTVISCVQQPKSPEKSTDTVGSDLKLSVQDTRLFLVETLEMDCTPTEVKRVLYDPGTGAVNGEIALPTLLSIHPIDTGIVCSVKSAQRAKGEGREARNQWMVQCDYSILTPSGSTPNSRNITITGEGVEQTIYTQLAQDSSKTQILNSADDLYPDPIEITFYDEIISVSYETNSLDMDLVAQCRGKINASTITMAFTIAGLEYSRSFAKHTVKVGNAGYEIVLSSANPSQFAFRVTIPILYRVDTWDMSLPQKGYRWYVKSTTSGADQLSEYHDIAQYLDDDGYLLQQGDEICTTDPVQVLKEGPIGSLIDGI